MPKGKKQYVIELIGKIRDRDAWETGFRKIPVRFFYRV
jgi:hypothetical protein